jgi:uncharacterized protein
MCGNCCKGGKGKCIGMMIAKILVIIGGINWGLIGIGMFFNVNWDVVQIIFSFSWVLEAIIYILVGIAAVMLIFGCKCGKCNGACVVEEKKEEVSA